MPSPLPMPSTTRASGRFRKLFVNLYKSVVLGAIPVDVNAMTLATADKQGRPSARVVLLKGVDERGRGRAGATAFARYDA